MPEIGETIYGRELGLSRKSKRFVWHACDGCGKERWVQFIKGNPVKTKCPRCSHSHGEGHNNWKGGRWKDGLGYVMVWLSPNDFFLSMANKHNYVLEHSLIMAKSLGRNLHRWEIVHHLNHIRDDNRIENLQLVSDDRHKQITILENRIKLLERRVLQLEIENIGLRQSV